MLLKRNDARPSPPAHHLAKIFSERGWTMAALLLLLAAALCLVVFAQTEAAFVAATLGVIAWFFGLRNRLAGASIEAGDDPIQIESENKVTQLKAETRPSGSVFFVSDTLPDGCVSANCIKEQTDE